MENNRQEIGQFNKNDFEVVKVTKSWFKGKEFLDIRIWVYNKQGELVPTQKGISLNVDLVDELKSLIDRAEKQEADKPLSEKKNFGDNITKEE